MATSKTNLNKAYEAAARKMARRVGGMDRLTTGVFRFVRQSDTDLRKPAERYVISEIRFDTTNADAEAWLDKHKIAYRNAGEKYVKIFSTGVANAVKHHMQKNNIVVVYTKSGIKLQRVKAGVLKRRP